MLTANETEDFTFLTGELADALVGSPPPEQNIENLHQLLLLARDELEENTKVFKLLNKYALERVTEITKGITRACRRVCKIQKVDGGAITGILVGPDLVLTAMHDMHGAGTIVKADELRHVEFDEFRFSDGTLHNVPCNPARTAIGANLVVLHSSPDSELDYVIFRLDTPIGLTCLGASRTKRRGWMDLSTVNVEPAGSVVVLQHAGGKLMRVSKGDVKTDTTGVPSGRFRYDSITETGSSGAPVLNEARQLIGMHVKENNEIEELISLKAIFQNLKKEGIRLPRYPPTKTFTDRFAAVMLAPQTETAFV